MNEKSNLGRLTITGLLISVCVVILYFLNASTGQDLVRIHWIGGWLGVFYIGASIRFKETVQTGFNAVLQRFGKNVATLEPGLHFAPLWIYKIKMVDMQIKQEELPADPEKIWLGEIDATPEGKKPALRVTFRSSIKTEEAQQIFGDMFVTAEGIKFYADVPNDGLARRVTAPVVPVVEYSIKDPQVFFTRFADFSDLRKILEDETFRVINMLMPNMSIGQALANKAWINSHLKRAIMARIDRDGVHGKGWGIEIFGAYIKNLPLHHSLTNAISAASEAEFQGRAIKELKVREGEGVADAARSLERETLTGRAEGIKALEEMTGLTAEQILGAEIIKNIGESGNTVVMGSEGLSQLFGVAAATLGKGRQDKPEKKKNP